MRDNIAISESDLETDFEYNFDVKPFNYILDGLHWLLTTPFHLGGLLVKIVRKKVISIQEEKAWKKTFKGPACILR